MSQLALSLIFFVAICSVGRAAEAPISKTFVMELGAKAVPIEFTVLNNTYWVSTTEVTQEQMVAGLTPLLLWDHSPQIDELVSFCNVVESTFNKPIHNITWYEAMAFCNSLTQKLQAAGCLPPGCECRLPTSREWSAFAKDTDEHDAIVSERSRRDEPQGVRMRTPNPLGLYDVAGNVAEWCMDAAELPEPDSRMTRGSTYKSATTADLSLERPLLAQAKSRIADLGFRCVVAPVIQLQPDVAKQILLTRNPHPTEKSRKGQARLHELLDLVKERYSNERRQAERLISGSTTPKTLLVPDDPSHEVVPFFTGITVPTVKGCMDLKLYVVVSGRFGVVASVDYRIEEPRVHEFPQRFLDECLAVNGEGLSWDRDSKRHDLLDGLSNKHNLDRLFRQDDRALCDIDKDEQLLKFMSELFWLERNEAEAEATRIRSARVLEERPGF